MVIKKYNTKHGNLTSLEYGNIPKRLNFYVSRVRGVKSKKIVKVSPFLEVYHMMINNPEVKKLGSELLDLKSSNNPEYAKLKENKAFGFLIGKFNKRDLDGCTKYVPCLAFDIDKVKDFFTVMLIIASCKNDPYIFAAFPSPSKRGLRILMWTSSTMQTHKIYYEAACEHLSKSLNIPTSKQISHRLSKEGYDREFIKQYLKNNEHIDQSTSNISRVWFFTHNPEEDIYLNPLSDVFIVDQKHLKADEPIISIRSFKTPTPLSSNHSNIYFCDGKVLELLDLYTNSSYGRNVRVHTLACKFFENSFDETKIFSYLSKYLEPHHPSDPFKKSELLSVISKAKNQITSKGKLNMYTREQTVNYLKKIKS